MQPKSHANRVLFWLVAAAALTADLATKYLAFDRLAPGEAGRVELIPRMFSLLRQEGLNRGALFGIGNTPETGATANLIFAVISGAAVLFIILWSFRSSVRQDRLLALALALILGGAAGNLYDRLAVGGVRDFLWAYYERAPGDFPFNWPVFNLADAWLVLGAGLMFVQAFLSKPAPTPVPNPVRA